MKRIIKLRIADCGSRTLRGEAALECCGSTPLLEPRAVRLMDAQTETLLRLRRMFSAESSARASFQEKFQPVAFLKRKRRWTPVIVATRRWSEAFQYSSRHALCSHRADRQR